MEISDKDGKSEAVEEKVQSDSVSDVKPRVTRSWPAHSKLDRRFRTLVTKLKLGGPSAPEEKHESGFDRKQRSHIRKLLLIFPMPSDDSNLSAQSWKAIVDSEDILAGTDPARLKAFALEIVGDFRQAAASKDRAVELLINYHYARRVNDRQKLLRAILRSAHSDELSASSKRLCERASSKGLGSDYEVPRSDLALLRGVLRYGFGRWHKMKDDPELNLFGNVQPDESGKSNLPKDSKFTERLRYVTAELLRDPSKKTGFGDIQKMFRKTKHESGLIGKQRDFVKRLILVYPMPKGDEYPDCWKRLVAQEPMLEGADVEKVKKFCLDCIAKFRHASKLDSSPSKKKELRMIPINTARRYVGRVRLLRQVLRTLHHPEVIQRSKQRLKVRWTQTTLGKSWITPDSDLALMKGVERYGFGNWEEMRNDPELNLFQRPDSKNPDSADSNKPDSKNTDVADSSTSSKIESKSEAVSPTESLKKPVASEFPKDRLLSDRLMYVTTEILREAKVDASGLSLPQRECAKKLLWVYPMPSANADLMPSANANPMPSSNADCWQRIFRLESALNGVDEVKFRKYCLGLIAKYEALSEMKAGDSPQKSPVKSIAPTTARRVIARVRLLRLVLRALDCDELEARGERIKQKQS
eukprot:631097_1